jgi:hypothetical protein
MKVWYVARWCATSPTSAATISPPEQEVLQYIPQYQLLVLRRYVDVHLIGILCTRNSSIEVVDRLSSGDLLDHIEQGGLRGGRMRRNEVMGEGRKEVGGGVMGGGEGCGVWVEVKITW